MDAVFALPASELHISTAWLGAIAFTIQIYFDFSGYSDMAIGLAAMFGVRFGENFDRPYSSRSITEFWRRWHISLSNWFRDYVYIPLGGNRRGTARTAANLLIVFFLTGLWHGAAWTFVAWGMIHGAFLLVERVLLGKPTERLLNPLLRYFYVAPVIVASWVLFRADTLGGAAAIWREMAIGFGPMSWAKLARDAALTPATALPLVVGSAICLLGGRVSVGRWPNEGGITRWLQAPVQVYALCSFIWAAVSVVTGGYNPFLYFKF